MKKQYQIRTTSGSQRSTFDTLANVQSQPDALEIKEFDENSSTYFTKCRKIDNVWLNEDVNPLFS